MLSISRKQRKVSEGYHLLRQFANCEPTLCQFPQNFINPYNPSISTTSQVFILISSSPHPLQKSSTFATISSNSLPFSVSCSPCGIRCISVSTGLVGFVSNFFKCYASVILGEDEVKMKLK